MPTALTGPQEELLLLPGLGPALSEPVPLFPPAVALVATTLAWVVESVCSGHGVDSQGATSEEGELGLRVKTDRVLQGYGRGK